MKRKSHNEKVRKRLARKTRTKKRMERSQKTALTVFRSSKHIYAQLVDIQTGRTLTTVSSRSKGVVEEPRPNQVEIAKKVGAAIAAAAREKQIDAVVFNRNGFLYHGRIKALAEGAREAGLNF